MSFNIVEVNDDNTFNDMASLILSHEYSEIDCDIDKYLNLLKNYLHIFDGRFFRAWVAYNNSEPIGYISGINIEEPRNEIMIHDHYIKPEMRGVKQDKALIKNIIKWAEDKEIKRISWTSDHQARLWQWMIKNMTKKKVLFKQLYFISCEVCDG